MHRRRLILAALCTGVLPGLSLGTLAHEQAEPAAEPIRWRQLAPQDGSLERYFSSFNRKDVSDTPGDVRTQAILGQLKSLSREMPTLSEWDGRLLSLPGFAVMYNNRNLMLGHFFLSPYQITCAHYPPPPGNQLIHVQMAQPMPMLHAVHPLILRGRLQRMDTEHPTAFSLYALLDAQYEHFDGSAYGDWGGDYPYL